MSWYKPGNLPSCVRRRRNRGSRPALVSAPIKEPDHATRRRPKHRRNANRGARRHHRPARARRAGLEHVRGHGAVRGGLPLFLPLKTKRRARVALAPAFALGLFCFAAGFLPRRLCRRQLDHGLAGHRIGEAEAAAEIVKMLAQVIEHADHLRPRVDDVLEFAPFADDAEGVVAGLDQRTATEALEIGALAMQRDELLLVARLDAETHNIERRHIVLPKAAMIAVFAAAKLRRLLGFGK